MGVDNIITFDAHDPRVQNAIPLNGFETVRPTYQFVKGLLRHYKDLKIDSEHMMAISPDEGATGRAIYLANVLNLDMGMFYKRRDYTKIVNGRNPIVAHEFLGSSVEGKDVIILDMIITVWSTIWTLTITPNFLLTSPVRFLIRQHSRLLHRVLLSKSCLPLPVCQKV